MTRNDPTNKDVILVDYGTINNDTRVVTLGIDGKQDLLRLVAVGLKHLKLSVKERKDAVQPAKLTDAGLRLISIWVLNAEEVHIKIKPGGDLEKILDEMKELSTEAGK